MDLYFLIPEMVEQQPKLDATNFQNKIGEILWHDHC